MDNEILVQTKNTTTADYTIYVVNMFYRNNLVDISRI